MKKLFYLLLFMFFSAGGAYPQWIAQQVGSAGYVDADIVGSNVIFAYRADKKILKSTDYGASWSIMDVNFNNNHTLTAGHFYQ